VTSAPDLRGPILAAIDLGDDTKRVVRHAFDLASELSTQLVLLHVLPELFAVRLLSTPAGFAPSLQTEIDANAADTVRDHIARLLPEAKSATVLITHGTAHGGILDTVERLNPGIVVIGPGRTAQRVARATTRPLLVTRRSPTGGGVLAATDLSDPSFPAIMLGAAEANRRGVRLRVVHCLDIDEKAYVATSGVAGLMAAYPLPETLLQQLATGAREQLTAAMSGVATVSETVVIRDAAVSGILRAAEQVVTSLIVVGTRGRTGLTRLALGSTAESIVSGAPCSVMVVPLHPA